MENERFICYLSCSKSGLGNRETVIPWEEKDFNQMVEYYYNPSQILENSGWYSLMKNPYALLRKRESVLITDKSIIELIEDFKYEKEKGESSDDWKINKITIDDLKISHFLDEDGVFKIYFRPIELIFKQDKLELNKTIPNPIIHDNKIFIEKIKKFEVDKFLKSIINADEKIEKMINDIFNNQLKLFSNKENYLYVFKLEKDSLDEEMLTLKENNMIFKLHNLTLEFFNTYLILLRFRDHLLNLYINNDLFNLENLLSKFKNSDLFLKNYEKKSLSILKSIDNNLVDIRENLIEIKEYSKESFNILSKISNEFNDLHTNLNELNDSNIKIVKKLNLNNFIGFVNLYQNYKINKNTKSLRE